jgi:hypothetical protein
MAHRIGIEKVQRKLDGIIGLMHKHMHVAQRERHKRHPQQRIRHACHIEGRRRVGGKIQHTLSNGLL